MLFGITVMEQVRVGMDCEPRSSNWNFRCLRGYSTWLIHVKAPPDPKWTMNP